jgi:hypothetical protein
VTSVNQKFFNLNQVSLIFLFTVFVFKKLRIDDLLDRIFVFAKN